MELARRQLQGLVEVAARDFESDGGDVEIYGGPIRLPDGVRGLAAVAEDGGSKRVVYVLRRTPGTPDFTWVERPDLDPDEVVGLISWAHARDTRGGEE